jgi:preprotein translocase subunit SecG
LAGAYDTILARLHAGRRDRVSSGVGVQSEIGDSRGMRTSFNIATYWISVVLGALTIVLVVVNFAVLSNNLSAQAEANQRQQFINQSTQFRRVDDLLIRTLAQAAVNAKDDKLRDLLAQQGVTLTPTPSEPTSAPGSPTPGSPAPTTGPVAPAAPPSASPAASGNKAP